MSDCLLVNNDDNAVSAAVHVANIKQQKNSVCLRAAIKSQTNANGFRRKVSISPPSVR